VILAPNFCSSLIRALMDLKRQEQPESKINEDLYFFASKLSVGCYEPSVFLKYLNKAIDEIPEHVSLLSLSERITFVFNDDVINYFLSAKNIDQLCEDLVLFQSFNNDFIKVSKRDSNELIVFSFLVGEDLIDNKMMDLYFSVFFCFCKALIGNILDFELIFTPSENKAFVKSLKDKFPKANIISSGSEYKVYIKKSVAEIASFYYNSNVRDRYELSQRTLSEKVNDKLLSQIKNVILMKEKPVQLSFSAISRILMMPESKLRKSLNQKKIKYQCFHKWCTMNLANIWLISSNLPVERLAQILGYSERASFERAYKNYVGHSPFKWRKHLYIDDGLPRSHLINYLIEQINHLPFSLNEYQAINRFDNEEGFRILLHRVSKNYLELYNLNGLKESFFIIYQLFKVYGTNVLEVIFELMFELLNSFHSSLSERAYSNEVCQKYLSLLLLGWVGGVTLNLAARKSENENLEVDFAKEIYQRTVISLFGLPLENDFLAHLKSLYLVGQGDGKNEVIQLIYLSHKNFLEKFNTRLDEKYEQSWHVG